MHKEPFIHVGVGAILFDAGRVLLVQRGRPPAQGMWAIPGGKVRAGESLHAALKREIFEETGLHIEPGDVVYVFEMIEKEDDGTLRRHYVVIDYEAQTTGGLLKAGDDALQARWVSEQEFATLPVHQRTRELLRRKYDFG
ncbi:MAG: NUDIX domain-containing protein [Calditrichaeota bacterium]|nr:MAG: NUDIX domain-containing protein [Calditrichota bacterium]